MKKVLVTGGDGFLASWIVRKLLEKGYEVKVTCWKDEFSAPLIEMLKSLNIDISHFSYVVADLTSPDGWDDIMKDEDYLLHIASPLSVKEGSIIDVAKKGTENVIGAAVRQKVPKIVMTSSGGAAVPDDNSTLVDEKIWTNLDNPTITDYYRSKTVAEQTAWDIVNSSESTELTTILPGAILGPFMNGRKSSTSGIFQTMFKMPSPHANYWIVDVRDIADLHVLAMESEAANGERFCGQNEFATMHDMALYVHDNCKEIGKKVKTGTLPNSIVKIIAKFIKPMEAFIPLMEYYPMTNDKAKDVLGWNPRPWQDTIKDTIDYMVKTEQL